ncbi:MAG TPA: hypothetical protein VFW29_01235 [Solirubrobacteraceae bacterium]|nr:hypothetical protein [Solirubrobacteraceae bacterium]
MRIALAGILGALAALVAASMIGVASAEAPTTTPTRTVAVQGVATMPLAQGSSASAATAVYRQAMAAAVTDGQSKAEFLTARTGAALGAVQSILEDGGSIECSGVNSDEYAEYTGEQPDFGHATGAVAGRVLAGAAAPQTSLARPKPAIRKKKHRRSRKGRAATVGGCKLSAEVSLAYAIG